MYNWKDGSDKTNAVKMGQKRVLYQRPITSTLILVNWYNIMIIFLYIAKRYSYKHID